MPHSEEKASDKMAAQVNGETAPSSAFLNHLVSYPVISDSIETFKANPYGAKSIEITTQGYDKLGKPVFVYLQKPYEYVSPYVKKADSIGDSALSNIDTRFPVIKKPTNELYDDGKAFVLYPLKVTNDGKEYVLGVYGSEKKKVGGDGIVTYGKAAIATGLIVSSDLLSWISAFLSQKKQEAKEVISEKNNN